LVVLLLITVAAPHLADPQAQERGRGTTGLRRTKTLPRDFRERTRRERRKKKSRGKRRREGRQKKSRRGKRKKQGLVWRSIFLCISYSIYCGWVFV